MEKLTPEEKLLRAILKDQNMDRNYPVKQLFFCPDCRMDIDISDPAVKVQYRDTHIGGRTFTIAEPSCPVCGKKIEAEIYINN
ncbi:MAG: hypothetical protein QW561_03010 [Candidatus Aenigmatarchaeota archaeon]